ncbi:fumarylacetoacetate hydrolase family protein [Neptunomonas sp.]|uniref:fumarylacetoacetate hydrolase family protein n=1 Tax=Neptunomonas sp. TaxID=1971898 RepID=UPI0035613442
MGDAIALDDSDDHVFGFCLFNDWSARDLQAWEYQPLGLYHYLTSLIPTGPSRSWWRITDIVGGYCLTYKTGPLDLKPL